MTTDTLIQIAFGMIMALFGYIMKGINERIEALEKKGCNPPVCYHRFEKIEERQDKTDAQHTEIMVKLATIETTLLELKNNLQELKKKG